MPLEEIEFFRKSMVLKEFKEGEDLIAPGENPDRLIFVQKGLFKMFEVTADGESIVKGFFRDYEMVMDHLAYFDRTVATHHVRALVPCTAFVGPIGFSDTLHQRHKDWYIIGLAVTQRMLKKASKRENDFLTLTASQRYENICKYLKDDIHRIPKKDIASYIGVQAESLSRVLRANR